MNHLHEKWSWGEIIFLIYNFKTLFISKHCASIEVIMNKMFCYLQKQKKQKKQNKNKSNHGSQIEFLQAIELKKN